MSQLDDEEDRPQGFLAKFKDFILSWGPAIFAVLFVRTFVVEPFRIPSGSMVPTLQIGDHVAVSKFSYGIWVPWTIVEIPFLDNLTTSNFAAKIGRPFGIQPQVVPRFQLLDFGGPARGDIVVFRYPRAEEVNFIKRIVAIEGDRIRVENNQIFLNGVAQSFEYVGSYDFINSACIANKTKRHVENLDGLKHYALTTAGLGGGQLEDMREQVVPPGHVFAMGDNRDFSEDSRAWGFVRNDQIKGKAHVVVLSWEGCDSVLRMDRFFHGLYGLD